MKTLKESIIINEAKLSHWLCISDDSTTTYLVCAESIEKAKEMVANLEKVETDMIKCHNIDKLLKEKNQRILLDSSSIKFNGDKK